MIGVTKDKDRGDRYRGCLQGLAAGDAVGTTLEFKAPGSFTPLTDMVGGGPFNLPIGAWTDDTSMALCLAESLIESDAFDPIDQMERYDRWFKEGYLSSTDSCFDIGNTVRQSLLAFRSTKEPFCGPTDPMSAGNGSLMRLAPVPMRYAAEPELAMEMAANSSRTTHGAVTAVDACKYYAGLIIGALNGVEKEELLSDSYSPIPGYWTRNTLAPEVAEVARGSFKTRQPPEIQGSGYVVQSLEAALWAFHATDSFREGTLKVVNLGRDADTTGAIYGQVAGALYGESGIPSTWLHALAKRSLLVYFADELLVLARGEKQSRERSRT